MKPYESWQELMRSIRKASHILNLDFTEQDPPDYYNWSLASSMNIRLWALVRSK